MKYLLSLILLCSLQTSFALTNITTPNVSGQWTLAGSPYIVQVNINVPTAASLKIDPGVEVQFYAGTKFNVFGKLIAKGTASQGILFCANDTSALKQKSINKTVTFMQLLQLIIFIKS